MDMQAQDRAHRIGQTKPVLIFRLITKHTIENTIMQRATEKRKLEALVIAKGWSTKPYPCLLLSIVLCVGKFKAPGSLIARGGQQDSLAEVATSLLKLEGEKIDVVRNAEAGKTKLLSDKGLDELLDRSPEVFADRVKGWTASAVAAGNEYGRNENIAVKTTFEVVESAGDEGNDALANMLGEDVE